MDKNGRVQVCRLVYVSVRLCQTKAGVWLLFAHQYTLDADKNKPNQTKTMRYALESGDIIFFHVNFWPLTVSSFL